MNTGGSAQQNEKHMSTQKQKFQLFSRLQALGFTYDEAAALRRIEMTLQRWGELECGDANGNCIERDEATGKPFRTYEQPGKPGGRGRYPIADREAGALRRLADIMRTHDRRRKLSNGAPPLPKLVAYHQGDCRGCNLFILKTSDVRAGESIGSVYTRGLAVCC